MHSTQRDKTYFAHRLHLNIGAQEQGRYLQVVVQVEQDVGNRAASQQTVPQQVSILLPPASLAGQHGDALLQFLHTHKFFFGKKQYDAWLTAAAGAQPWTGSQPGCATVSHWCQQTLKFCLHPQQLSTESVQMLDVEMRIKPSR